MRSRTFSTRRDFIRGAVAATAALPFLRSFTAYGATARPKLLFFASPSGPLVGPTGNASLGYAGWLPAAFPGGNGPAEMAAPAALPTILKALEPHRTKILAIDGIKGHPNVNSHQAAAGMLTGRGVYSNEAQRAAGGDGEWYSQGISVDQFIAARLGCPVLGMSYRLAGYQLGEGYISHLGPNKGFTPIQSSVTAFERVFGSGGSDAEALARYTKRRSVLDAVAKDLTSVMSTLPAKDRPRLEQHVEEVRKVENGLVAPEGCSSSADVTGYDPQRSENTPRLIRDYNQIMVQSLACGFTQVGFIQLGNLGGDLTPNWSEFGISTTYRDHAITHKFSGTDGAGSDGLTQTQAIPIGLKIQAAYYSLFADLLDRLAAMPDADGRPMLDHTVVVHIRPMGRNHDSNRLFWVIAGGEALGVRTGRFLRLNVDSNRRYYNDLHVALCQLMGLSDVTTFGDTNLNQGPLDLG